MAIVELERPGSGTLFDARAIAAELEALAKRHGSRERDLRTAVAQRLKQVLAEGRAEAERLLLNDRHGRRCAERLCLMMDEIIRALFEFAGIAVYLAIVLEPGLIPFDARQLAHKRFEILRLAKILVD